MNQFFQPYSATNAARLPIPSTAITTTTTNTENDARNRLLCLPGDDWKQYAILAPYYDVPASYFNGLTIHNEQRVVLALNYACDWHDLKAVEEHAVIEHLQTSAHTPYFGVPDNKILRQRFTRALDVYA